MNNNKKQRNTPAEKKETPSKTIQETKSYDNPLINSNEKYYKIVFWIIAVIIFSCQMFVATKVGCSGDEFMDGLNGKYSLDYYTDGDTTFADYHQVEELKSVTHLKYYGSGFEIIPAIFLKYFHLPLDKEYLFRHILCTAFGFILFLFTALTAKILSDWRTAIIALVFIASTPEIFGLSFLATKDIPFAAGFAMANFAFISIFKHLPQFRIRDIIIAILGIMLAVSIRIGGLLITLYLVLAFLLYIGFNSEKRKHLFSKPYTLLWKSLGIGTMILVIGCFLGLSLYPNFFYEGPIEHIKNATTLVSKFPQRIPMLFEGKLIDSLNLPEHYLLKIIIYTLPLFVYLGIFLFIINIVHIWKTFDKASILYLLCTIAIPFIIIAKSKANVYGGWRHEMFAYSGVAILASIGMRETWNWFPKNKLNKVWKLVFPIILTLCFFPTWIWIIQNHKYSYAYYNHLIGDPYMKFDQEAYQSSQTICLDWLLENELKDKKEPVKICVKNYNAVQYYKNKQLSKDSIFLGSFKGYASLDCDYMILSTHFLTNKYIKDFYPPKGTIHIEYLNGKPIDVVVKRNKLDSRGIKLVREGKFAEGMKLLDSAYKYDPNNFGIWFWLGYGAFQTQQYEKAVKFFDKDLNFMPNEDSYSVGLMYKGVALSELKRYDEAIPVLKNAESSCKPDNKPYIVANLAMTYYNNKNYKEAIPYLEASLQSYPFFAGLLQQCKVLSNAQSSSAPTNINNKVETTSQQGVTDLFKLK